MCHYTPAWVTEQNPVSKNKRKRERENPTTPESYLLLTCSTWLHTCCAILESVVIRTINGEARVKRRGPRTQGFRLPVTDMPLYMSRGVFCRVASVTRPHFAYAPGLQEEELRWEGNSRGEPSSVKREEMGRGKPPHKPNSLVKHHLISLYLHEQYLRPSLSSLIPAKSHANDQLAFLP